MTREEYGILYRDKFDYTVSFLRRNTESYEDARELAQAAWTRGRERISQLQCPEKTLAWVIEIGKNILKSETRRPKIFQRKGRIRQHLNPRI